MNVYNLFAWFLTATTRVNMELLKKFDQTEFFAGINGTHFMAPEGYLYVPLSCENKECNLHVYFHGCGTGRLVHTTVTSNLLRQLRGWILSPVAILL